MHSPERQAAQFYIIRVRGYLDARWSAWFNGMAVTHERNGCTAILGQVTDRAALYGLLERLRDLNLELLTVQQVNDVDTLDRLCTLLQDATGDQNTERR